MTTVKKWLGPAPSYCDVCCKPISSTFIDGRTVYGPWAYMCCDCHSKVGVGVGLGTGKGQKYERDNESWVKIAG